MMYLLKPKIYFATSSWSLFNSASRIFLLMNWLNVMPCSLRKSCRSVPGLILFVLPLGLPLLIRGPPLPDLGLFDCFPDIHFYLSVLSFHHFCTALFAIYSVTASAKLSSFLTGNRLPILGMLCTASMFNTPPLPNMLFVFLLKLLLL